MAVVEGTIVSSVAVVEGTIVSTSSFVRVISSTVSLDSVISNVDSCSSTLVEFILLRSCLIFSSRICFLLNLVIYPAILFFRPLERTIEIWFKAFLFSTKSSPNLDLCASNTSNEIRFILSTHELTNRVFYTYIPRKRFVLSSNKKDISSNVFSRIFEAQNITLGMKLI